MPAESLTPHDLPKSRRAMLLVDFINPLNFPGAQDLAAEAVKAARATAALKATVAAQGVPAIYANDNYGVWHSDFHSLVSACLAMKGPPAEITRMLYPQATDLTILKPRHSAFYASPLELLLAQIGARELVICGLATDMCVQLTAMDAFLREFEVWVPSDCTAAECAAAKKNSLAYMADVLKCHTAPAGSAARSAGSGKKRDA